MFVNLKFGQRREVHPLEYTSLLKKFFDLSILHQSLFLVGQPREYILFDALIF
jgi:hypothetical protein